MNAFETNDYWNAAQTASIASGTTSGSVPLAPNFTAFQSPEELQADTLLRTGVPQQDDPV